MTYGKCIGKVLGLLFFRHLLYCYASISQGRSAYEFLHHRHHTVRNDAFIGTIRWFSIKTAQGVVAHVI
jgi:hypothetical protein